jgi:hypothetical protein
VSKPKPRQLGGADKGKAARGRDDAALSRAHKGDDVAGSLRALGRLIGGKR